MEENFVKLFAAHAIKRSGNDILKFLKGNEIITQSVNTIFDKKGKDLDLEDLSEMSVEKVFSSFSSEISQALYNNENMFKDFASSDSFRLSNKKTNLLKKWISDGIIQEDCK